MVNDAALADYQTALLDLLARELPREELMRRLQEDAAFAPLRDYVAGFDADMVEVAALLVKKWGARNS